MTGIEQAAAAMTERELDSHVRRLAEGLGLHRYHTYSSYRSDPGFPDLVLAGPGGILFRELKRERGSLTRAQRAWLKDLHDAGGNAGTWRPSDLLNGQVARELAAITRLAEVTRAH